MSSGRRRKSRRRSSPFHVNRKRSKLRTIVETSMGIGIGLLIMGAAYYYYFVRVPPEQDSNSELVETVIKDNVVDDAESYEAVRDSGDLDGLLQLLTKLDAWPRDAETPVRIDTLNKRLEIAETILKHPETSEEQRVSVANTIINAMGQIYGISLEEKLDSEGQIYGDYMAICDRFLQDKSETVVREAKIARIKTMVFEAVEGEMEVPVDEIVTETIELVSDYPNDQVIATLAETVILKLKNDFLDASLQLQSSVVEEYQAQENIDEIRPTVQRLKDRKLLIESGLTEIAKNADQTGSLDEFVDVLGKLADNPDTGIEIIKTIHNNIDFFETNGKHDLAIQLLNRLSKTIPQRTDPVVKDYADRICRFGIIRNNAVGNHLDLTDTDAAGNEVDPEKFAGYPVLIAFYSPNNPNTPNLIVQLSNFYDSIKRTGVKFIVIAFEKQRPDSLSSPMHPDWTVLQCDPLKGKGQFPEIFKRLPVTRFPYFALIDRDGIVKSINVPIPHLKTRIELLASLPVTNTENISPGSAKDQSPDETE